VSAGIETAAGEMAVGKTPCLGALVSVGIETPAVGGGFRTQWMPHWCAV